MAYEHSNWVTITDTVEREAKLRLYIAEIEDRELADVSTGSKSRGNAPITSKLIRLYEQLAKLESINARKTGGGGVSFVSIR